MVWGGTQNKNDRGGGTREKAGGAGSQSLIRGEGQLTPAEDKGKPRSAHRTSVREKRSNNREKLERLSSGERRGRGSSRSGNILLTHTQVRFCTLQGTQNRLWGGSAGAAVVIKGGQTALGPHPVIDVGGGRKDVATGEWGSACA